MGSLPRPGARQHAPALPELDRLIHERIRLGIVSALATNDSLSFNDLKRILKTTDGNLSVHARKLEDAQYVSCSKYFEGRVPRTQYRLSAAGRRALSQYLAFFCHHKLCNAKYIMSLEIPSCVTPTSVI